MSNRQELLEYLRKDDCYLENQHFKLVSGRHSDTYIQARIGMMNDKTRRAFAQAMVSELSDFDPTMLASSTVGGILLASATADLLGVPLLVGRQFGNSVTWVSPENYDPKSFSKVALIDDIFTTGLTLKLGIPPLNEAGAKTIGTFVAIDRSGRSENEFEVDGSSYKVKSIIRLFLNDWLPDDCEICPAPYINLHNPEQDFLSVVLSMPPQRSEGILNGYQKVYELQQDKEQINNITFWRPWLPYLFAGLPISRVGEDSGLAQFIRLLHQKEPIANRKRVLTELVGHLLAVSNIKIESRSLGCSILIGDKNNLEDLLPTPIPVDAPTDVRIGRFDKLIPYYDALPETKAVFLFDKDGALLGIRQLVRPTESGVIRGIYLLRQLTRGTDVIGLVLRRKRKAITVYRDNKLEAIAELSEKTGIWEFNTTLSPTIKEITDRLQGIGQTLELVLEISREMVNRGYGGLFVIGDIPLTLQRKKAKIKIKKTQLESLGVGLAAEIAKLDGAMLISRGGIVQEASVIIVNTSDTQSTDPSQAGGSRRETARRTSLECKDVAVVCVSQNGTIDIFMGGKSWPISESISGVPG